jgi:hypothetical protein
MQTDESLIRQVIKLFEEKTGWGDSGKWTNQDFLQLSESVRDQTGVMISHVTLKRVWGKVKYDSLPNTHTLNTLVRFLGYENWRDFAVKQAAEGGKAGSVGVAGPLEEVALVKETRVGSGSGPLEEGVLEERVLEETGGAARPGQGDKVGPGKNGRSFWRRGLLIIGPTIVILLVLRFLHAEQPPPLPQDYAFSSKKVVTAGLPNSVIFDYDASRSPDDSVVIQQSWDTSRRVKVPKNGRQFTSVYYYPDFYHATLQVRNQVVKTHNLLIGTNGWLPLVEQRPVPVYFKKEEAIHDGKISLSAGQIAGKNIPLQPSQPTVMFANVGDFGDIYSDHFTFETSLRNDYSEGSAVCQLTQVYILCEGTAIWVPLCAKGCVSNIDLYFTYFYTDGKREDLSAFGVNFDKDVKLRIESDSGRARILINDKPAYTVTRSIRRAKIVGIMYRIQGTGSVDYVTLTNGKVNYRENF